MVARGKDFRRLARKENPGVGTMAIYEATDDEHNDSGAPLYDFSK
ncbi:MAG: hypothetical protein ABIZ04_20110 [Opitutus sp.]